MTFQDAIKTCFSKYATFTGRAQRSELWWFVLFLLIVNTVLSFVDSAIFGQTVEGQTISVLGGLFSLGVFLPSVAVGVRRLHDLDKSGWWYLLVFIPLIGALILVYFFVQKGSDGPNQFGPDPLATHP
ncbi:DUF805 domain-containing protein [Marivita sp. S0852]|uniref:DUF805 domain-containing protein n=1 Tax=Marivita sp. S0852 TaxID=3373893 RepID=UPI003982267A